MLFVAHAAFAQAAAAQGEPAVSPPPVATPAPEVGPNNRSGFVDAFGRWMQEGREKFDAHMKGAREALGEFHNKAQSNAKEAAGALTGATKVIDGRARCDVAQNGAPDCAVAANSVCTGKGFQAGKSVATQTEQKCSARVWLSGRTPSAGDCKLETYVTRAVCQ
jgi:hypothetical protein